jgi:AraC-like DNA-binding protein
MLGDIASPGTALSRIGVTIRWIRENFTTPRRAETLAAMAALSVSAFHPHFKAVTALSRCKPKARAAAAHAQHVERRRRQYDLGRVRRGLREPDAVQPQIFAFSWPAPVERHAPDRAGDTTGSSLAPPVDRVVTYAVFGISGFRSKRM